MDIVTWAAPAAVCVALAIGAIRPLGRLLTEAGWAVPGAPGHLFAVAAALLLAATAVLACAVAGLAGGAVCGQAWELADHAGQAIGICHLLLRPNNETAVRARKCSIIQAASLASKYSRRTPCSASGWVSTTRGVPSSAAEIRSVLPPKAAQRPGTLGSERPR